MDEVRTELASYALGLYIEKLTGLSSGGQTLIGNDLANGVLVQPFRITVPSPHKYYLVYPPRQADSSKLAVFWQWVLDEIAEDQQRTQRIIGGKAERRRTAAPSVARSRRKEAPPR